MADVITDITDDLEELKNRIPIYSSRRAVGGSLVKEASGFFCEPCGRFFLDKKKSEKHLRTQQHYDSFVKILNEKAEEAEDKKRKLKEEAEKEEGNWKRRKVDGVKEEGDEDQNEENGEKDEENEEQTEENEEGGEGKESKGADAKEGDELYDPADSFMASDPNDVVMGSADAEQKKEDDKVWQEVDKELDSILESKTEDKPTEEEKSSPQAKAKSGRGGPKARRGRKN